LKILNNLPIFSKKYDIQTGMKWLWNDTTKEVIDRMSFATQNTPLVTTVSDRTIASTKIGVFAGSEGNDTITGSKDNDFIFGGLGKDRLSGSKGMGCVSLTAANTNTAVTRAAA
jgi:Ca2+-binding RTX toxin-like protein